MTGPGTGRLTYAGGRLDRYYTRERQSWAALYPSERWVFERLFVDRAVGALLDVGCAAGGVGRALQERFGVSRYTGIDINADVIAAARALPFNGPAEFAVADVVSWDDPRQFDAVIAMGVADWNVDSEAILRAAWARVAPGGHFVLSLRLTDGSGIADPAVSYQHVETDDPSVVVHANYVVFNVREAFLLLHRVAPDVERVLGYGYWGAPSSTAVTPYTRLAFAVFSLTKGAGLAPPVAELHLPFDLLTESH